MTRGASTVYFTAAGANLFRIRFYCWRRLAAAIKMKETFSLTELVSLMLLNGKQHRVSTNGVLMDIELPS